MTALLLAAALFPAADPKDAAPKGETFTSKDFNFEIDYPPRWKPTKALNPEVVLYLTDLNRFIIVHAVENNSTLEELLEGFKGDTEERFDGMQVLDQKNIEFKGGKAIRLRIAAKVKGGGAVSLHVLLFTRQGVAYRLTGGAPVLSLRNFDTEFDEICDSLRYLGDRKAWVARHVGKPRRTAMCGGLVEFELARPRWDEHLEGGGYGGPALDTVHFALAQGGGWAEIRARRAEKLDVETEMKRFYDQQEARLKPGRGKDIDVNVGSEIVEGKEIEGRWDGYAYRIRAAAFERDGVLIEVNMDALEGRFDETRTDWEKLLASFRVRKDDPAKGLPLFGDNDPDDAAHTPDPVLSAVLEKATPLKVEHHFGVVAVSGDGKRMLRRAGQGVEVEHVGTRRREPLHLDGRAEVIDWSADGSRLLTVGDGACNVQSLLGTRFQPIKAPVRQGSFVPGKTEVVAAVRLGREERFRHVASYSRLERIDFQSGERKVLVEYPLCRIELPAADPDGTRVAMVANRDYPRRAMFGGYLYVCDGDGKNLRQLTKVPGTFQSLAWSPDGRWLYAIGRLKEGRNGEAAPGTYGDLYRVDPKTGVAENLTRCDSITRAWVLTDGDLVIAINRFDVPESQRGMFRLNPNDLAKATARFPTPPTASDATLARDLAAAVQKHFGKRPIDEVTPTPELMPKLAKAFTAAAKETFNVTLDDTAASVDRLRKLQRALSDVTPDRVIVIGMGACYGELLRKHAAAQWRIKPLPFSKWLPGNPAGGIGGAFADAVDPFSESVLGGEDGPELRSLSSLRVTNRPVLLVYPPAHREQAVRDATPPGYTEALARLDAGDVQKGLDLLIEELGKQPRNLALAHEVFEVLQGTLDEKAARAVVRRAVENGCEARDLLQSYADEIAETDPEKALGLYRKAAGGWPTSNLCRKMAKLYRRLKQPALADCCLRRAAATAPADQRDSVMRMLNGVEEW